MTDSAIKCLSQNRNISLCLFHCMSASYDRLVPIRRSLSPLSLWTSISLSLAESKSKTQQQTSWTRLATQTMITSCTQSQQWNHSRAYIGYLIRSVCDLMFDFLILMRARKPSDRKSVQSRYASWAQLMKIYKVFLHVSGTLKETIHADCKLSGAKQPWGDMSRRPFFPCPGWQQGH